MPRVWQKLRSYFTAEKPGPMTALSGVPVAIPVVALIVDEQDRRVVSNISIADVSGTGISAANVSSKEAWDVHFADSCEQASAFARRFTAPVILLDRDWPGTDWKAAVASLAALPHHACVILVSGVADAYLWQEVVRQDGYDILAKPLQAENVLRSVKLALSYWSIRGQKPVAVGVNPGK